MKSLNKSSKIESDEYLSEPKNRRVALGWLAKAFVGSGASIWLIGCGEKKSEHAAACVDPSSLTQGELSLRQSNNYVGKSATSEKRCGTCVFFTAEGAGCGRCEIFLGVVDELGHCDSWASKSA